MDKEKDIIGENHIGTSAQTPLREDAFLLSDEEKIARIEKSMTDIMLTLGLDLSDDSLKGTPRRVAKAYVKELFGGSLQSLPFEIPTSQCETCVPAGFS